MICYGYCFNVSTMQYMLCDFQTRLVDEQNLNLCDNGAILTELSVFIL